MLGADAEETALLLLYQAVSGFLKLKIRIIWETYTHLNGYYQIGLFNHTCYICTSENYWHSAVVSNPVTLFEQFELFVRSSAETGSPVCSCSCKKLVGGGGRENRPKAKIDKGHKRNMRVLGL